MRRKGERDERESDRRRESQAGTGETKGEWYSRESDKGGGDKIKSHEGRKEDERTRNR